MVASSAIARTTMSRPSSVVPIFQNFARAERPARAACVVAMNVLGVGQLARRPNDSPEKLEGRGHGVRRRKVIDELGRNPGILKMLRDEICVFLVNRLHGRLGAGVDCRIAHESRHHRRKCQRAHEVSSHGGDDSEVRSHKSRVRRPWPAASHLVQACIYCPSVNA